MTTLSLKFPSSVRQRTVTVCAVAAVAGFTAATPAAAQQGSVYSVTKIAVEAEASDAVKAKQKAIADGQERALQIVFRRVAPYSAYAKLPRPKAKTVDRLVGSFSVRKEAYSTTKYLATLDFDFSPPGVRKLLQQQGVDVSDSQAPGMRILPLMIENGKVRLDGTDPWSRAWSGLDLANARAPAELVKPQASMTLEGLTKVISGGRGAFNDLLKQHNTERLVLALAYASPDGQLSTRLYGIDSIGPFDLVRNDRLFGARPETKMADAAATALAILSGRWRIGEQAGMNAGSAGPSERLRLTVEFSGLGDWQDMRARLEDVQGIRHLQVGDLSARGADVSFDWRGGVDALSEALVRQGLRLENTGDTLILRKL